MSERAFERIFAENDVSSALRGGVVAIGNFDGMHRGHQAVLERALSIAGERGCPALILTFEPHPRTVFKPDSPVFRLTPAPLRARLAEAMGFDAVVECAFTEDFARRTAARFVDETLKERLEVGHVVTGFDFHFGRGREGGPAFLMEAGERDGFGVTLIDAYRDENTDVISSSRIRGLLAAGNVAEAAGLLGYRFTVSAEVEKGRQLGRTLGYPTANMRMPDSFALAPGIYAVRFRCPDGTLHDGVASFGFRPTVDADGMALLETYAFDFDGDLYGKTCQVSFFAHLRDEEKFDSLDDLVVQMKRDEEEARAALSGAVALGPLDRRLDF